MGCTDVNAVVEQAGGRELGKLAIVTGGGRGIGRAIAQAYLQEDAGVVVTATREKAVLLCAVKEGSCYSRRSIT